MARQFIRAVRSAFSVRTHPRNLPQRPSRTAEREADREVVSGHSSGNVQLQQGLYSTSEDIKRERAKALTYEI